MSACFAVCLHLKLKVSHLGNMLLRFTAERFMSVSLNMKLEMVSLALDENMRAKANKITAWRAFSCSRERNEAEK